MGFTDSPQDQPNNDIGLVPAPPYEQALHHHSAHPHYADSSSPPTNDTLSRLPRLFFSIIGPAQPAYSALSQHDHPVSDLESQTQEPATRDASTDASADGPVYVTAPFSGQGHVHCEQCTEFALRKQAMKHRHDLLGVLAASFCILAWLAIVYGSLAWGRK